MAKRILLAGILGGVVLFVWGSLSHMVFGLGEIGIQQLPNEDEVLTAMRNSIPEPGFYFFPGMNESPGMTKEQQKAAQEEWAKKWTGGPNGILVYHPRGEQPLSPKQLATELGSDVAAALVAAFLVSLGGAAIAGFSTRVLFVTLLGLIASLDIYVSYWNWYGFPGNYTLAVVADELIGFCLMGIVLAWRIKPAR